MNQIQNRLISIWQEIMKKAETGVQKYSSEKALCFDYAWLMKEHYQNSVKLDFESVLFENFSDGYFLDLLANFNFPDKEVKVGFEFKFPKSSNFGNTNQTQTRIKIINDIKRLTWLVREDKIDFGCFLCATDQLPYINKGHKRENVDFATYHQTEYLQDTFFPIHSSKSKEKILSIIDIKFIWTNIETDSSGKHCIGENAEFAWLKPIFINKIK